jgi:Uma2 family endonuclease
MLLPLVAETCDTVTMRVESDSVVMTADELERLDLPGKSTELVRGRLVVREPPGSYHGKVAAKLAYLVGAFVYPNGLGALFGQDTGFKIASNPDTVRAPDLAFLRQERASEIHPRGYGPFAPDLVAEIVSPDDRPGELLAKVGEWLDAGVKLVWVIDPRRAEAHVHRPDGSLKVILAAEALDGEDVLPGFSCRLSDVFD